MANGKIKVTLTGSYIGCKEPQKRTLRALGLRKRDDSRIHDTTPAVLGMVDAVKHEVTVEPVA
jgi:large subunit ribosomal protein L30